MIGSTKLTTGGSIALTTRIKVLVTGVGAASAQSAIKGLRLQKKIPIKILGADSNLENAGRFLVDEFYQLPEVGETNFFPKLLSLVKAKRPLLLVPIVDAEFLKLSQEKEKLEKFGCKMALSSPQTIKICQDKWQTHVFFRQNNYKSAPTFLPADLPRKIKFPLIIKPRDGRSTHDTYKLETKKDLEFYLKKVNNPIIQEWIKGQEYTADTISDFKGNFLGCCVRKRIETRLGISYKGETVRNKTVANLLKKLCNQLRIIGPANIQFFKRGKDLILSEVNPRFSGGLPLSIAAGFNSPLVLLELALGQKIKSSELSARSGVKMFRYWSEVFT